jgi:hypothetical protein
MSLATLGIGYVAIGGLIAIVLAAARRRPTPGDTLLVIALWPLYAPLSFALSSARTGDDRREVELLAAIARAQTSPLASALPDAESARVLASRLREAGTRLDELDAVLARPDFDPQSVERRAHELAARGAMAASATAHLHLRTLGQLRTLRERYRSELDEVGELIAHLVAQAELVRLQPSIAQSSGELVRELVARVEGLGELFAYQTALETGQTEEYAPHPGRLS